MISALESVTSEITGFETPIGEKEMSEWQLSQIRAAMERAASHSEAYAKCFAGIDIASIDSPAALERIPFTYPQEIIDGADALICVPRRDISRVTSLPTSGSTGAPKRIYFTEKDLARTERLFELGMAPIIGGRGRRCVVMMSDATPGSMASLLKSGVEKSGVPAAIYGGIRDFDDAARFLCDGDVIVGLPSQMIHLCRKHPTLRPESVLLSADYVPAPVPGALRKTWKCRVYTHYGMTESCFGCAVQCSQESAQHIRHDSLLIEIIDPRTGRPLPPDKEGEVVVTAFANEAMPLFRYRTGDISSLVSGKCECGSALPRLGAVRGRLKNLIKTAGGGFSIESVDDVLYRNDELWRYDASLREDACGKILSITAYGSNRLKIDDIYNALSTILPREIAAEVAITDKPCRGGGKRRIIDRVEEAG